MNTFAYIILSINNNKDVEAELSNYYWGGVIEAFMDCEEQWLSSSDLWPFDWGLYMKRISVVQLVEGHNPCCWLSMVLSISKAQPLFVKTFNKEGTICMFKSSDIKFDKIKYLEKNNVYFSRFTELLRMTITSLGETSDIVFIGGKGFSVDFEIDLEDQLLLSDIGFKITSRLPNDRNILGQDTTRKL